MKTRSSALRQEEIIHFSHRYNTGELGLSWLKNIENYEDQGIVNTLMCEFLVTQCRMIEQFRSKAFYQVTKSLFDRFAALLAIIVLSPIMLLIAIAIKLDSKGPVFFLQTRFGQYCGPFKIIKFRTMHIGAERKIPFIKNEMKGGLFKLKNDPRITRIGNILRKSSLDELPQLFNVLFGNMSLVGPRPLPAEDTSTIAQEYFARFAVRPGITGLWQVSIRGSDDGLQKIRMDCIYAQTAGWKLDLFILVRTVPVVLRREGAA